MADFGLSAILGLVGAGVSAAGTIAAGNQQDAAAKQQALNLEAAANEEKAASQREAEQKKKERDFLLSRSQSVAASSNLGALDDTVLELAGDIAEEAAFQEGMIRYGGDERAIGRRSQAAAARIEGKAAKTGAMFGAAGTIMGGMGSFAKAWEKKQQPSGGDYRYGGYK